MRSSWGIVGLENVLRMRWDDENHNKEGGRVGLILILFTVAEKP